MSGQLSNKGSRELISLVRKLIPPLLPTFHKGQAGRIAVIGGCEDYTGAPFFSASAAALFGCDLSHVICEERAATVIKSYSPDLMVHPYLQLSDKVLERTGTGEYRSYIDTVVVPRVTSILSRIHVAIIGPGLGRDSAMLYTAQKIINILKDQGKPFIVDADGLFLLSQHPELVQGYRAAILTPNVVEFQRLAEALGIKVTGKDEDEVAEAISVSKKLGGVTVVRKGAHDIIVRDDSTIVNRIAGSSRRVGGQGDTLTGLIATMIAWGRQYHDFTWDHADEIDERDIPMLAVYGAAVASRVAQYEAFNEKGRAMQTTDVQRKIGKAYKRLFDDNLDPEEA